MRLLISLVFIVTFTVKISAQNSFKVELPKKEFLSSFVYSISSNSTDSFNLEIINISTRSKVVSKTIEKTKSGKQFYKIDLSELSSGSYHFIISNDQKKFKRTIIKPKS